MSTHVWRSCLTLMSWWFRRQNIWRERTKRENVQRAQLLKNQTTPGSSGETSYHPSNVIYLRYNGTKFNNSFLWFEKVNSFGTWTACKLSVLANHNWILNQKWNEGIWKFDIVHRILKISHYWSWICHPSALRTICWCLIHEKLCPFDSMWHPTSFSDDYRYHP